MKYNAWMYDHTGLRFAFTLVGDYNVCIEVAQRLSVTLGVSFDYLETVG